MAKKVIIIDDSRIFRQLVAEELEAVGYEVIQAVDGRDGIIRLRSEPMLSLAICDVNMPQMGGFDLLNALTKEPLRAPLPIVMLTSDVHPSMIDRAKAGGAKGWLLKPLKPGLLVSVVRRFAGVA